MKKILILISAFQLSVINAQIENDLVVHFSFNNSYNDISSNSITGYNNGTFFTADRNGLANSAIELNGNDFVSFISDSINVEFPITISTWVRLNSLNESNNIFFSDTDFDNYSGFWLQTLPNTGQPVLSFGGGTSGNGGISSGNRRSYISDFNLQVGVWHNIIGIIRAHNDMDIYVDCMQTTGTYSGSGPTAISYIPSESRIGSAPVTAVSPIPPSYNGFIDQFAIWKRELTALELTEMCNTNNTLAIESVKKKPRELLRIVNMMGQECVPVNNTPLIYQYDDGSTEIIIIQE
ncbi:MAG: LamG-like jellyroll fold domain-containing protein [Crocinitomicaceae bacterium]